MADPSVAVNHGIKCTFPLQVSILSFSLINKTQVNSRKTQKQKMAPKAKQGSTALKQGTLSFASSKRGAPATVTGKANAKASPGTILKPSTVSFNSTGTTRRVSQESTGSSSIQSASDRDEDVAAAGRAAKRLKISSAAAGPGKVRGVGTGNKRKALDDDTSSEDEIVIREDLEVLEKSGNLNKVYGAARERMGNLKPSKYDKASKLGCFLTRFTVHGENQTKAFQILRVFDKYVLFELQDARTCLKISRSSYEFGPCVGVTRLERWERAQALGLNPPSEVSSDLL